MTQTIHRPGGTSTTPLVTDIPNLDTPPPYVRELASDDGHQRIELPSGHSAICLTSYENVKTLMLDRTASGTLCNVDGGGRPRRHGAGLPHRAGADGVHPARHLPRPRTVDERARSTDSACSSRRDTSHRRLVGRAVRLGAGTRRRRLRTRRHRTSRHLQAPARQPEFAAVVDTLISGTVMGIVLGGDNNVATMLGKTLYASLAHRDLYSQVVDDPSLVPDLVEEIMRLMPLGTPGSFPRELTRPLNTTAGPLPVGEIVYPHINAANRDPAVFDAPLEIRLDRPRGRHLQYGYGMHRCMGSALAQTELIAILTRVVTRYPDLALRVDPSDVEWDLGTGLRRPAVLPVDLGVRGIV